MASLYNFQKAVTLKTANFKFPSYGDCEAKPVLDDLFRLVSPDLFNTEYIDARSAAHLVATALGTYRKALAHPKWSTSPILSRLLERGGRLNLVCAALFDLVCNAEYVHGRVTNRSWIYCNRHRDGATSDVYAYYSFLKQCPKCCQDRGLDPRISGAQHKPTSHHIGEITTVATAYFLKLLAMSGARPLEVGIVSKQSHNVDALGWRDDLVVLFEIKASPLVTYPLRVKLAEAFTESSDEGPVEIKQHKLIDVEFKSHDVSLYLANTDTDIPLGPASSKEWPYPQITQFMSNSDGLLAYMEAWGEIFLGYSVPKVARAGRDIVMGYLANGWGDEIDSNKTKAGLGRTDDIKKGTYQLLKFGAYYRDGSPNLEIRGALTANLDPLFMYKAYMEKLIDARWAPAAKFRTSPAAPEYKEILERDLFYIYDAVLAFNRPIVNDPLLSGCFDFDAFEKALVNGELNDLLQSWKTAK